MRVYLWSRLGIGKLAVSLLLPLLVVLARDGLSVGGLGHVLAALREEGLVGAGILSSLVLELLEVLLLELVAGLVRQVGGERSVVLLVLEGVFRQALSGYLLVFHLVHIKLNLLRKQTDECWVDLVLNAELFGQLDWLIILSYQDVC